METLCPVCADLWQGVALLRDQRGVSSGHTLCGRCDLWALPGDGRLAHSHLKDWYAAHCGRLLARSVCMCVCVSKNRLLAQDPMCQICFWVVLSSFSNNTKAMQLNCCYFHVIKWEDCSCGCITYKSKLVLAQICRICDHKNSPKERSSLQLTLIQEGWTCHRCCTFSDIFAFQSIC